MAMRLKYILSASIWGYSHPYWVNRLESTALFVQYISEHFLINLDATMIMYIPELNVNNDEWES
jgi:hypothetical protein